MEADDIGADDGAEVEAELSGYAEAEARFPAEHREYGTLSRHVVLTVVGGLVDAASTETEVAVEREAFLLAEVSIMAMPKIG